MNMAKAQSGFVTSAILWFLLVFAFTDETMRKVIPSAPVLITGIKLIFLLPLARMALNDSQFLGTLLGFSVFLLLVIMYLGMSAGRYGGPLFVVVTLSIYVTPILAMAGGGAVYRYGLWRRIHTLTIIGLMTFALAVGFGQEFFREALPAMFSRQITEVEQHAAAGGKFIESLFISQTVWAVPLLGLIYFCCSMLLRAIPAWKIAACSAYLVAAAANLMFVRKRISLLLAALGVVGVLILTLRKSEHWRRIKLHRGRVVIFGAVTVFAALSFYTLNAGTKEANTEADLEFSSRAFDLDTITTRLFFFTYEFENLSSTELFIGTGPGSRGQARKFITNYRNLPEFFAHDTGAFLLVGEIGLCILLTGMVPYLYGLWLISRGAMRAPQSDVVYPALTMLVYACSGWFFFKSHALFQNSFCVLVWFGSYGYLLANARFLRGDYQTLPGVSYR